jgi:hypothetical protein
MQEKNRTESKPAGRKAENPKRGADDSIEHDEHHDESRLNLATKTRRSSGSVLVQTAGEGRGRADRPERI